jgi:hypothetical protein
MEALYESFQIVQAIIDSVKHWGSEPRRKSVGGLTGRRVDRPAIKTVLDSVTSGQGILLARLDMHTCIHAVTRHV